MSDASEWRFWVWSVLLPIAGAIWGIYIYKKRKKQEFHAVWTTLSVILVWLAGAGVCKIYTWATKPAEATKVAEAKQQPQVVVQRVQEWTIRDFTIQGGGIVVRLHRGWKLFTTGGDITITKPGGGIVMVKENDDLDLGWQPEGDYILRPDPPGSSRKVKARIYNRWDP